MSAASAEVLTNCSKLCKNVDVIGLEVMLFFSNMPNYHRIFWRAETLKMLVVMTFILHATYHIVKCVIRFLFNLTYVGISIQRFYTPQQQV